MMTHEDCVNLSQLIGSVKRAKGMVTAAAAQIAQLSGRYAGTVAMVNGAGVKSLVQARYWLEQAVDTLELSVKNSRAKGGAK